MHTLWGVSSLLLVALTGYAVLRRLDQPKGPQQRRDLLVGVLAAPIVSLGVGLGGLHHFLGRTCFLRTPPWDYALGMGLPLTMGLVALGGLFLGVARLGVMWTVTVRRSRPAGAWLQALTDRLAARMRTLRPRILLYRSNRPFAIACGIRRPAVLLSTWMVDHLDRSELESVLAHELGHVARRDYLMTWLATVLRDGFLYMPTSWLAYRRLQQDNELACDDLAVKVTKKPLALASALKKLEYGVQARPMDANPATAHMFIVNPLRGSAIMNLFSTHPPIPE
ncbi:MAG: M48 family metalloprotease, partial [Armatimonadetes bacterium]|nr:M48 family metalloprotease [Armatimonadota bacterium]